MGDPEKRGKRPSLFDIRTTHIGRMEKGGTPEEADKLLPVYSLQKRRGRLVWVIIKK